MSNINDILISTSISTALYVIYKTINHYRLKSECNKDNNIITITIVDTNKKNNVNESEEKKDELPALGLPALGLPQENK